MRKLLVLVVAVGLSGCAALGLGEPSFQRALDVAEDSIDTACEQALASPAHAAPAVKGAS